MKENMKEMFIRVSSTLLLAGIAAVGELLITNLGIPLAIVLGRDMSNVLETRIKKVINRE